MCSGPGRCRARGRLGNESDPGMGCWSWGGRRIVIAWKCDRSSGFYLTQGLGDSGPGVLYPTKFARQILKCRFHYGGSC